MNKTSYLSLNPDGVVSNQQKRASRQTITNAIFLFAALLAFTGACMMFRQNPILQPWKESISDLVQLNYPKKSSHITIPVLEYPVCPDVHTWHTISAIHGNWLGLLGATYENVTFADKNCKLWKNFYSFALAPESPQIFGLKLGPDNTFDVTYSIAVAQANAKFEKGFGPGRKCVWVAAAEGPAYPDVRDLPYNGATCLWERIDGVGENYQVDYWEF